MTHVNCLFKEGIRVEEVEYKRRRGKDIISPQMLDQTFCTLSQHTS